MDEVVSTEKKGRICGRFLCDMRRAVIIVNIITMVLGALVIVSFFFLIGASKDDVDEEELSTQEANAQKDELDSYFTVLIVMVCLGFVFSGISIYGAYKYQFKFVLCNAVYIVVSAATQIVVGFSTSSDVDSFDYGIQDFAGLLVGVFFGLYMHISLIKEIRAGIMTKENYPNEEYSCCCV